MKIVVCVKQVPDTTEVKLDPKTNTLIREGIPSIINPDDKAGLEAALTLREQVGGTVAVVTMGPPQADSALREALAMGADSAYLVTDRAFGGADTLATSTTIAAALRTLEYDLIIAGRQAIDGDTAQVGPQLAEHLGLTQVSYVEEIIEATETTITVRRRFEDRSHIVRVKLPCLITTLAELNTPRYMSVSGIFSAYREKTVTKLTFAGLQNGLDTASIGLAGSPTRVKASFPKQPKGAGEKIETDADEAVKVIMDRLIARHII